MGGGKVAKQKERGVIKKGEEKERKRFLASQCDGFNSSTPLTHTTQISPSQIRWNLFFLLISSHFLILLPPLPMFKQHPNTSQKPRYNFSFLFSFILLVPIWCTYFLLRQIFLTDLYIIFVFLKGRETIIESN